MADFISEDDISSGHNDVWAANLRHVLPRLDYWDKVPPWHPVLLGNLMSTNTWWPAYEMKWSSGFSRSSGSSRGSYLIMMTLCKGDGPPVIKQWSYFSSALTHWGLATHICISKLTIIGSDNGFSSGRRQAIIWTNAGLSSIGPLKTNFSEILIKTQNFSFTKMHLKISSGKRQLFCPGGDVLNHWPIGDAAVILN